MQINRMWSLALLWGTTSLCGHTQATQTVARQGMQVSWSIVGQELHVQMQAPTTGWVAIGLNPVDQLAGTSLLMGRVSHGHAEVTDHWVLAPGDYRPVVAMGVPSAVTQIWGQEQSGGITELHFCLSLNPGDAFHHHLRAGQVYYLLVAYSQEDDFAHHSLMRTTVKINL